MGDLVHHDRSEFYLRRLPPPASISDLCDRKSIGRAGVERLSAGDVYNSPNSPDCGAERCGSFQEMAGYAVTLEPPIVVVAGGTNDVAEFVRDPTGIVNAIYDTMGTLRTGLPTARIIAVGPSSAGEVPPFVTAYEGMVRDAVNAVGGEFVSLTDPDVIDEDMLDPDGVHVDDRGHAAIAEAVEQALK